MSCACKTDTDARALCMPYVNHMVEWTKCPMRMASALFRINNDADLHSKAIKGDFSFLHSWFAPCQDKEDMYQIIHCWVRDWLESEYDCVAYDADDEANRYQTKKTHESNKDDDKNILITEPPPLLPVERIGDMCQRCGVVDNRVLPGLGYYHRECFVSKTQDDKVKPKTKASKCEEIVTLAKQTYDSILRATGDRDKACKMMAQVFITTFCE